jgi:hypothetical protein
VLPFESLPSIVRVRVHRIMRANNISKTTRTGDFIRGRLHQPRRENGVAPASFVYGVMEGLIQAATGPPPAAAPQRPHTQSRVAPKSRAKQQAAAGGALLSASEIPLLRAVVATLERGHAPVVVEETPACGEWIVLANLLSSSASRHPAVGEEGGPASAPASTLYHLPSAGGQLMAEGTGRGARRPSE